MKDAEFIVVCIDNSSVAHSRGNFKPQRDAIEHYCKAKLDANPETEVVLFTMATDTFGPWTTPTRPWTTPTSDLQEILDSLTCIFNYPAGALRFKSAIIRSQVEFLRSPNKQKRMLFLVGGFVDLYDMDALEIGLKTKAKGIAVDVVNFCLEGTKRLKKTMLGVLIQCEIKGELKSTWIELDAFVEAVKSYGNSHIEHVQPGSSIPRLLSRSILRNTLRDSRIKTDHRDKATYAAGDNKRVRYEGKRKREDVYYA